VRVRRLKAQLRSQPGADNDAPHVSQKVVRLIVSYTDYVRRTVGEFSTVGGTWGGPHAGAASMTVACESASAPKAGTLSPREGLHA
jgi:hypothetical protein